MHAASNSGLSRTGYVLKLLQAMQSMHLLQLDVTQAAASSACLPLLAEQSRGRYRQATLMFMLASPGS